MFASLPLTLAAGSFIILSAAWLATRLLRGSSAASRHMIWLAAIIALLALPLLSMALPAWNVLPAMDTTEAPLTDAPVLRMDRVAFFPPADVNAETPIAESAPLPWAAMLTALWATGVALLLAMPLLGWWRLVRLEGRCRAVVDEHWARLLEDARRQIGIARQVTLLRSDQRLMPMTWGIMRPRLLIPADADGWADSRKKVVLLHELAHMKRMDTMTHLLSQFARALYWFNPLAWLAMAQMRHERERACDDMVLSLGTRGPDYATHLVEVAAPGPAPGTPGSPGSPGIAGLRGFTAVAMPMARSSRLEGRVRDILDDRRPRNAMSVRGALAMLALMLLIALPVACIKEAVGTEQDRNPRSGASTVEFTSDTAHPATIDERDLPPASKRQRFVPQENTAKKTSWSVMDKPSVFNPDGWAVMARMALDGKVPVKLANEQSERFRMQLLEGDDDAITLRLTHEGSQPATLTVERDRSQEAELDGRRYRVRYSSVEVGPDQPDTTPFAHIILTPADPSERPAAERQAETLNERLDDLQREKKRMALTLGEQHRDMIKITAAIDDANRQIERQTGPGLVDLQRSQQSAERLYEAGRISKSSMLEAEIAVAEARAALAESEGNLDEMRAQRRNVVNDRKQLLAHLKKQYDAGRSHDPEDLIKAQSKLLQAKAADDDGDKARGGWPADAHACGQNIKNIAAAIHIYHNKKGQLPPDLGATLPYIDRFSQMSEEDRRSATAAEKAAMYICASGGKPLQPPAEPTPQWINQNTSYVYLGKPALDLEKLAEEHGGTTVLVHEEFDARHLANGGQSLVVAFVDGHAELLPIDQARRIIDTSKQRLAAATANP